MIDKRKNYIKLFIKVFVFFWGGVNFFQVIGFSVRFLNFFQDIVFNFFQDIVF